jgi:hypothetical protein
VTRAPAFRPVLFVAFIAALTLGPALVHAQFIEEFDDLQMDPDGLRGWSFFAGDGAATISLGHSGRGYATVLVDATRDRRNIWWALIKRQVSGPMDLGLLGRPGYALRIEARLRVSHAPRRVNLHLNTQRTTDFHSHLMEFDIPDANTWQTISFTTRDFDARPGDTVFGQLALMDWGLGKYIVDVDFFRADVVELSRAGPDLGAAVPYHPPVSDASTFREHVPAAHDSTIDASHPDVNLNNWSDGTAAAPLLAVGGMLDTILRFDLRAFAGRTVAGHGLLELTTRSLQRSADELKDFGLIRVVEILGGDGAWDQRTVTANSIRKGLPIEDVFNPQMIIDWPVTGNDGGKTYLTISRPVLQRLVDGRTLGLAIRPLGAIMASFYSLESDGGRAAPRLLFNVGDSREPID